MQKYHRRDTWGYDNNISVTLDLASQCEIQINIIRTISNLPNLRRGFQIL